MLQESRSPTLTIWLPKHRPQRADSFSLVMAGRRVLDHLHDHDAAKGLLMLSAPREKAVSAARDESAHAAVVAEEEKSTPRITVQNAHMYPPPRLDVFRSAARRGKGSEPAVWFMQMTGKVWNGDVAAYKEERVRHRDLCSCAPKSMLTAEHLDYIDRQLEAQRADASRGSTSSFKLSRGWALAKKRHDLLHQYREDAVCWSTDSGPR